MMAVVVTLFATPFTRAATLFWDGGSVDILDVGSGTSNGAAINGASGTWNTTILNWDAGIDLPHVAWNNAANDTAEINGGTQTLTLGTDITVGRINQKAGANGATIAESGSKYSITLGSAPTIFNVAASSTAGRTLNVNAEVTGNNNLSIQGPTGLTPTARGAVNLNRVNTFTGTLSIADTTLRIGNGGTAGQLNSGTYSSAISITDADAVFEYSSNLNQTLSGVISGAGKLAKNTVGSTLTLTNSNTYSGTTTINGGKLVGVVGGHHQNSDVTLADALATYGVSITDNTKSWTCKSLATTAAGTLEFDFGAVTPSGSVVPLAVTNLADFSATPLVSVVVSAGLPPGFYPLMTWGSTSGTAPTTAELTVSAIAPGTVADLSVSGNTLYLVIDFPTTSIVKANNALPLNDGLSWVGGVAPSPTEVARWNNIVTSANTTDLGADITLAGIAIENPTGPVTINPGNTLTLGAVLRDIDMRAAASDLNLNCSLALGNDNIWDVATGRTLTIGGTVSGNFPLAMQGSGTIRLGAGDLLPDGAGNGNVTVDATLDLNGNSETLNGLSGSGIIDNTAGSTVSTLTVGGENQNGTFNGVLQNSGTSATLNLTKVGTGTLTLGGANTMGGAITITGGTLVAGNVAPFDNVTGITMGDGTTLRSNVDGAAIDAPIALGGVGTTATINASIFKGTGVILVPFSLSGAISGGGNLTLSGIEATNSYGAINLNTASNYAGSTLITTAGSNNANIFVNLGIENALPVTTVLTLDGGEGTGSNGRNCQLDLNGNDQTLAGLANVMNVVARNQTVTSTGAPATLTVNNSDDYTFGRSSIHTFNNVDWTTRARIQGDITLVKSGVGKFTLLEEHTYTGSTTITGGTLALGSSTALPAASEVSIADGTLSVVAGATAATIGALDCTGAAVINLGSNTSSIAFGVSNGTWSGTLTITGKFVSGASLRFGEDADGLAPAQIAAISGPGLSDIGINSEGFITATVAASAYTTWAATNAGGQSAELDFDNDGVTNGVEFFLNAAPGFTANPVLDGSNVITWTNGGNIPASAYGTQFVVQTSGNLVIWADVLVGDLTTNTDGPGGSLTYTLTGTAPRFVRLQVVPD
jgi:autotransporter-associated beta strand protein